MKNLNQTTKEQIAVHEMKGVERIHQYITKIEKMIKESVGLMLDLQSLLSPETREKKFRYCRYHKSNTHDSKDCKKFQFLENQRKSHLSNIEHSTLESRNILQEKISSSLPKVYVKANENNIAMIIDTGAQKSYTTRALVDSHFSSLPLQKTTRMQHTLAVFGRWISSYN
jgi:hypothetical protein